MGCFKECKKCGLVGSADSKWIDNGLCCVFFKKLYHHDILYELKVKHPMTYRDAGNNFQACPMHCDFHKPKDNLELRAHFVVFHSWKAQDAYCG